MPINGTLKNKQNDGSIVELHPVGVDAAARALANAETERAKAAELANGQLIAQNAAELAKKAELEDYTANGQMMSPVNWYGIFDHDQFSVTMIFPPYQAFDIKATSGIIYEKTDGTELKIGDVMPLRLITLDNASGEILIKFVSLTVKSISLQVGTQVGYTLGAYCVIQFNIPEEFSGADPAKTVLGLAPSRYNRMDNLTGFKFTMKRPIIKP